MVSKKFFLIASIVLSSSILLANNVQASPTLTEQELAKAREMALQLRPPVDFDLMLQEAERLGIECKGDFNRRTTIAICNGQVNSARSKERQAKLDEEFELLIIQAGDIAREQLKKQSQ